MAGPDYLFEVVVEPILRSDNPSHRAVRLPLGDPELDNTEFVALRLW